MKLRGTGSAVLLALASCTASHTDAPEPNELQAAMDQGPAPVTWSIPEHEQPPLLDGAAEVLRAAALSEYQRQMGRFLSGSPAVYEGALALDGGARGGFASTEVMATWTTLPSLWLDGVRFDEGAHELEVLPGPALRRAKIWQDRGWANFPEELLPESGRGAAWIQVTPPDEASTLRGRCISCMTILREPPVDAIEIDAEDVNPELEPIVPLHARGLLARIAPEAFTHETFERLWHAQQVEDSEAVVPVFHEVAPGTWELEHDVTTYLRCKEGGSRLVDFTIVLRLQEGEPERSGIGSIEVWGARSCEAFDYGGGS